jgi:uncharacterized membrane protein
LCLLYLAGCDKPTIDQIIEEYGEEYFYIKNVTKEDEIVTLNNPKNFTFYFIPHSDSDYQSAAAYDIQELTIMYEEFLIVGKTHTDYTNGDKKIEWYYGNN